MLLEAKFLSEVKKYKMKSIREVGANMHSVRRPASTLETHRPLAKATSPSTERY